MPDSNFWAQVVKDRAAADLLRSHHELRAILTLAAKRIKQQSIGRQDDELLKKMRQVYREARAIAREFEQS